LATEPYSAWLTLAQYARVLAAAPLQGRARAASAQSTFDRRRARGKTFRA
jgi:hypothetical protein